MNLHQLPELYRVTARLSTRVAAEIYRAHGFETIATLPGGKHCVDETLDKTPACMGDEYWEKTSDANVALITGLNFWVLDVDGAVGKESLKWLGQQGVTWNTFRVLTPRGIHYYFERPTYQEIPTSVRIMPGIDVRGTDGIIMAPPSRIGLALASSYLSEDGYGIMAAPPALYNLVRLAGDDPHQTAGSPADYRGEEKKRGVVRDGAFQGNL